MLSTKYFSDVQITLKALSEFHLSHRCMKDLGRVGMDNSQQLLEQSHPDKKREEDMWFSHFCFKCTLRSKFTSHFILRYY